MNSGRVQHINTLMSMFGSDIPLPDRSDGERKGATDAALPMARRPKKKTPIEQPTPPPPPPAKLSVDLLRKGAGVPPEGPAPEYIRCRVFRFIVGKPYGAELDVPLDWLVPENRKRYQNEFFSEMVKIASIHLKHRPGFFQFQWVSPSSPEPAVADMSEIAASPAKWESLCASIKETQTIFI